MLNIVVVQESNTNAEIIKKYISEENDNTNITCAESGVEAINIVKEQNTDILIISVELKDISGIEVVSEIRKNNKDIYIIFTSQYDYFEFVRKAIQLGVSDYILEPVEKHNIVDAVEKIQQQINDNKKAILEKNIQNAKYNKLYSLGKRCFVTEALSDKNLPDNINLYRDLYNLSEKGFWMAVELENKVFEPKIEQLKIESAIEDVLLSDYNYVIGSDANQKTVLYISTDDSDIKKGEEGIYGIITRKIETELIKKFARKIYIGVGSVQKLAKQYVSFEEAIKVLAELKVNKSEENILHIKDIRRDNNQINSKPDKEEIKEYENKMVESIKLGKEDMLDCFMHILNKFESMSITDRKNRIFELIVLACNSVGSVSDKVYESVNYVDLSKALNEVSEDEIYKWALKEFNRICGFAKTNFDDRMSETVRTAMQYVYEHFDENISLQDISNRVGVSLQYFSKIFKDEVGCNFVEWVNRLRINKAKDYMNLNQYTIKEVCYKVGYNDPNYFSRIFKKYENMAPSEYVKQL